MLSKGLTIVIRADSLEISLPPLNLLNMVIVIGSSGGGSGCFRIWCGVYRSRCKVDVAVALAVLINLNIQLFCND